MDEVISVVRGHGIVCIVLYPYFIERETDTCEKKRATW